MKRRGFFLYHLKVRQLSKILTLVLVVLLSLGVVFYWQGCLDLRGLTMWISGLAIIGIFFVLGLRTAQREGFIDGFRDGQDGVKKISKSD